LTFFGLFSCLILPLTNAQCQTFNGYNNTTADNYCYIEIERNESCRLPIANGTYDHSLRISTNETTICDFANYCTLRITKCDSIYVMKVEPNVQAESPYTCELNNQTEFTYKRRWCTIATDNNITTLSCRTPEISVCKVPRNSSAVDENNSTYVPRSRGRSRSHNENRTVTGNRTENGTNFLFANYTIKPTSLMTSQSYIIIINTTPHVFENSTDKSYTSSISHPTPGANIGGDESTPDISAYETKYIIVIFFLSLCIVGLLMALSVIYYRKRLHQKIYTNAEDKSMTELASRVG